MYSYQDKALTLTKSDLTAEEAKLVESLVSLGDSEELALWTVEHLERAKPTPDDVSHLYA